MNTKLIGYVVNIWDPLNFQIHLEYDDFKNKVYNEEYTYYDVENELKKGIVYRCRLKNLKIKENWSKDYKELLKEVTNKIDRQNGWVICRPVQIDKYERLIIDMFDPINLENFYETIIKYDTVVEKYF